jgi:hypothetical protein
MPHIGASIIAALLLGCDAARSVASQPASAESPASEACVDSPAKWADPDGDGCQVYAEKGWCHVNWISHWNNTGKTAKDACCQCGGGVRGAAGLPVPQSVDFSSTVAAAPVERAPIEASVASAPLQRPAPQPQESHDFAGVHPSRLPKDVASAVAEGSLDMATAVASGVWPPKTKSWAGPAAQPLVPAARQRTAIAERAAPVERNPYLDTLTSPSEAGSPAEARDTPEVVPSTSMGFTDIPASAQRKATAPEPLVEESIAPQGQQSADPVGPDEEQLGEAAVPTEQKQGAVYRNIPLDQAGRRNPLLAWKVGELEKEAQELQKQLREEEHEREEVLRRDGVEIGSLQAQSQNERTDLQKDGSTIKEWKNRAAALQIQLNNSRIHQEKEKRASTASFHRLEKMFHELERKAEAVQGQERWDHQEVQQLQAKALQVQKRTDSSKDVVIQLQTRLQDTTNKLSKALAVATKEKKNTATLLAWKDKATKAIEEQGQRLMAEKSLEQKMKSLLAKEKQNDKRRDEKMYALELRVQKAESEKQLLMKKNQEQANRIVQFEEGDDVHFDDEDKVMTQSTSTDGSDPSTTTTTEAPVAKKAQDPLLSSWARMVPQFQSAAAEQRALKSTTQDSTVAGVPQEIRQSSALWNLWKQSNI